MPFLRCQEGLGLRTEGCRTKTVRIPFVSFRKCSLNSWLLVRRLYCSSLEGLGNGTPSGSFFQRSSHFCCSFSSSVVVWAAAWKSICTAKERSLLIPPSRESFNKLWQVKFHLACPGVQCLCTSHWLGMETLFSFHEVPFSEVIGWRSQCILTVRVPEGESWSKAVCLFPHVF